MYCFAFFPVSFLLNMAHSDVFQLAPCQTKSFQMTLVNLYYRKQPTKLRDTYFPNDLAFTCC